MKLYRTGDMEGALASMSRRNHHVVALADHRVKKMIRLRGRSPKLAGVPMLFVMGWKPEAAGVLAHWQDVGGVLVYRPLPAAAPSHPASDALLFVECPLQYDWLESRIANVRQEAVVYRPPTWDLHEHAMGEKWPHRHQYETMEAVLASLTGRELTDTMRVLKDLMPHWSKFAIFSEEEIGALTGWEPRMLRAILLHKYLKRYVRFPVFQLRFAARHHDIKWAYEVLTKQPSIGKKLHVLRGDVPFEGPMPSFKAALRMLVHLNYVSREGAWYMVNTDAKPLDLDRIEAVHNMHRGKWFKVRNFVDSLEEYTI